MPAPNTEPGQIVPASCPACACQVAANLFDAGSQPLSALAWPETADEARRLPRFPLEIVRCVDCGHVFNAAFDYSAVPYSDQPNRMYNGGAQWSEHLDRVRHRIVEALPSDPTVVEIGCGDGHLLRALAQAMPHGRFIGFDIHPAPADDAQRVERYLGEFQPAQHLPQFAPDMIVLRHILEHLPNPLQLLQMIAAVASECGLTVKWFLEVPCVQRALESGRTVDFFYEHHSHFTAESLARMLERCRATVDWLEVQCAGEVVSAIATVRPCRQWASRVARATSFNRLAERNEQAVRRQLQQLRLSGKRIAIWGGTGKGVGFMHRFCVDAENFPLVVDSDPLKAGSHVPGTGQQIRFRDYLHDHPVDVIVITTAWRALDIVHEIDAQRIPCESVLVEQDGRLVDWLPHCRATAASA